MKNIFASLVCLIVLCTYTLLKGQRNAGVYYHYTKENEYQQALKHLMDAGLLDSALSYCNELYRIDSISAGTYDFATATLYSLTKDADRSYDVVMKGVNYELALHGGGGHPFQMLDDYAFGTTLPADTFLEQMIINKVSDYYATYNYPESGLGLQLISICHQNEKLKAAYQYEYKLYKTAAAQQQLKSQYETASEEIKQSFRKLIENNGGLLTEYQIGLAHLLQYEFINDLPTLQAHQYFRPYMDTSFKAQKITADIYAAELISTERLKDSSIAHLQHFEDSLRTIYYYQFNKTAHVINDSMLVNIIESRDSLGNKRLDTALIDKNRMQGLSQTKFMGTPGNR
jgi:hypothetical protein